MRGLRAGRLTRLSACTACSVFLAVLASLAPASPPDTSTTAVVKAASLYVLEYERQLTSILADELYTQQIAEQQPRDPDMPMVRQLRSEVFFMFGPYNGDWMAIRDVKEVDGDPLHERMDLAEELRTVPAIDVAARFKDFNSRYNIGRTQRNFNEPTLSLLVLDERHRARFSFDRRQVQREGDAVLVTLRFTERRQPTLIHDPGQGPLFATGELVVEAGSGRIRSALLRGAIGGQRLQFATTFTPDDRLGIWVPSVFREQYEFSGPARSREQPVPQHEKILCEATYTNFRRFATSARIK
jgi:hypothetical protein